MLKGIFVSVLFMVCLTWAQQTQPEEFICGMEGLEDSKIAMEAASTGGVYITSSGIVKARVIFIQFSDDTEEKSGWPLDSLPDWALHFLNPDSGNNFPHDNLSQYFYEMSGGIFQLIGDVYPSLVYPDRIESYYSNLGQVNYEILTRLDSEIDYSVYDNWSGVNPGPDGDVDMIFMIYRNFSNSLINDTWTGYSALFLPSNITADGVTIRGTGSWTRTSGVQTS